MKKEFLAILICSLFIVLVLFALYHADDGNPTIKRVDIELYPSKIDGIMECYVFDRLQAKYVYKCHSDDTLFNGRGCRFLSTPDLDKKYAFYNIDSARAFMKEYIKTLKR